MNQQNTTDNQPLTFFYMAFGIVTYMKEDELCERNINTLVQTEQPHFTLHETAKVRESIGIRVCQEEDISSIDLIEVCLVNLFPLAHATSQEFFANPVNEQEDEAPSSSETASLTQPSIAKDRVH